MMIVLFGLTAFIVGVGIGIFLAKIDFGVGLEWNDELRQQHKEIMACFDDIANEHKDRIKSQKEFEREFQCEFKREPRKSRYSKK